MKSFAEGMKQHAERKIQMDPKDQPTTTKRGKQKPKVYELLQGNDAHNQSGAAASFVWDIVKTDRPIKGLSDAVKYCREKKLKGEFKVKATIGTFKIEPETRLKVTVG